MSNRILVLTSAMLLCFAFIPAEALAQKGLNKREKNQLKRTTQQLKKIKNNSGPTGKVRKLVLKATRLNPKKASQYYNLGVKKLRPADSFQGSAAEKLGIDVIKVVGQSGDSLNKRQIKQIENKVEKRILDLPLPPTPTPTPTPKPTPPYNAMLDTVQSLQRA